MVDSKINASGQSMTAWISQFFACMGSCLCCCCNKSSLFFAVDKSSNGTRVQGQTANKPSLLEDFFSSSTCDLDIGALQSHRSLTSTFNTSYQTLLDRHSVVGSMSNPPFVNDGLLLWNQTRQEWTENIMPENRTQHVQEPGLSGNANFDLLGSTKMYPQPIPLSEMVYFLVDTWEQEGLYD